MKNVEFIVQIIVKDIDLREPVYTAIEEFPGKFKKTSQGALDVAVKVIDTTSGEIKLQDSIIVKMSGKAEVVSEKKSVAPRDMWKSMSNRGGKEIGERIISSVYPTFEVVKVTGKQIIIKGGITNGIDVDQEYELYSVTEDIIDEKTIAGTPGWEKIKGTDKEGNVKDKSGAVHTPMSRAKDLARQAFKKIKTEMLGKISN